MRIDYFEEFPTAEDLARAGLIHGHSLVYLASHSLAEFNELSKALLAANPNLKAGYWPVLKESYWISPFANTHELQELKTQLAKVKDLDVLLDLELPLLKSSLFFRNLFSYTKNKRIIREILLLGATGNVRFSTAEYPFAVGMFRWLFMLLGVSYNDKQYRHQRIVMYYSSMAKRVLPPINMDIRCWLKQVLRREVKRNHSVAFGLGTLAVGVLGNEPILTPQELENDLAFCATCGVSRVVLFRLGGLTEDYIQIISKFN